MHPSNDYIRHIVFEVVGSQKSIVIGLRVISLQQTFNRIFQVMNAWVKIRSAVLLLTCSWIGGSFPASGLAGETRGARSEREVGMRSIGDSPNIIVVLTDDQGYGDVSAHGNPILKTPNLDRLEKESRTFTNFFVSPVLLSDPVCEIWNPNAIRSSLGAIFRVPIGVGREPEIRAWLEGRGVSIFAARADAGIDYSVVAYPNRTALVVGSEAFGLEDRWSDSGVSSVHIPMGGVIDSLNASVSGSILVFEVIRQWRHTTKF